METKTYILENLDCANCAAKIEAKFNALPQVRRAVITFATRQLILIADEPDALIPELEKIARTVEGEVRILPREQAHHHHHGESCGSHEEHACQCGHSHHEEHPAHNENSRELAGILIGAALFVLGLVLNGIGLHLGMIFCCVAAYLVLGWGIIATAGNNIVKGNVFDENFLMSIATVGAFVIGEYPEAVGVMLFYRLGEFFEHKAVERSRREIMAAVDMRPEVVTLESGDTVPAGDVQVGDVLLVHPGDRIPLDGTVIRGESRLDTSPITGEPVPLAVEEGNSVISGCVNLSGLLTIRVDKALSESMVTRILNSVENAAASKPKIDRFITRFSRIYTPAVVLLAAGTAVIPSLLDGNWNYWVYTALSFLVMSCPCALVLSVPLAFFSGIGAGSKLGILFKGGLSIEALAGIKAVVMDKTGTVTKGDFTVQQVEGGMEVLRLCASMEKISTHPIAESILSAARENDLTLAGAERVQEIAGYGLHGFAEGKEILCGNEKLMQRFGIAVPETADAQGETQVFVAIDGVLAGTIRISDTVKPEACTAVKQLHQMGMKTAMLTGDRAETAEKVAKAVGIQLVHARLLPQEKLEKLGFLRKQYGPVMFVGDGINDAPVLAGADVGAAMGSGADAAMEAADVVFMTSRVTAIGQSLEIAKKTRKIAWQNVIFALSIKAIVMVLGLFGFASMWAAVFADSGVAMLCVLNSIRMLYRKQADY